MRDVIRTAIVERAGGADSHRVAGAVVVALALLREQLVVVVGMQAADALCAHALHRTRSEVAWTVPATLSLHDANFDALRADLASRAPADSLVAGETLIVALVDHLVSLIGKPLTHRMVESAWSAPDSAQTSSGESFND